MPDIALVVLVVVSISISALAVSNLVFDQTNLMGAQSNLDNAAPPAAPGTGQDAGTTNDRAVESDPQKEEGVYGGAQSYVPDSELLTPASGQGIFASFYSPIYESAHYIMPITWGAVAGALIWRGKVRSAWCKQGYDYETFRLMSRMKGSPVRAKLLTSVTVPKNRLQLANELDLDWKTIDNHMEILTRNGLVEERTIVGTTRYYVLSEHGRRVLCLLSEGESDHPSTNVPQEPFISGLKN